jgi:hypothetical protein
MATAVLPSDDNNYFSSSLRRSHSQPKLDTSSFHRATTDLGHSFRAASNSSGSTTSSPPASPRTVHADSSSDVSYASTPVTSFSIASDFDDNVAIDDSGDSPFTFPEFEQQKLFIGHDIHHDYNLEPPPSLRTTSSCTECSTEQDNSGRTSRPGSPEFCEHAEDDTAITSRPTRQVDYLSHEWKEEDIWSSWRYVVARRGEFANSARLENASWRTWVKSKNNLKTVSPETLNWLKDCDVTWLYGPLQQGVTRPQGSQTEPSSSMMSKSESLVNLDKKPILKKRSMSEVMLRKSLSTASLLKQATAAVQAQETRGILRPKLGRASTDYVSYPSSSRRLSQPRWSSLTASTDSSGVTSPSIEKKHIHFNEQVEQCIAVEVKGDDDEAEAGRLADDDDSSDSDVVVMKRRNTKKRMPLPRRRSSKHACPESKTIAKLPSTTLKYREDTPELPDTAMKHSTGVSRSPIISPSSSQETLRPAKRSTRFFIYEDEDEDIDDSAPGSVASWASNPDPSSPGSLYRSTSSSNLTDENTGMHRTSSGMLMPPEIGDSSTGDGIFGRVIDTVNTARDIAHVIWNVGWRT